MKSIYLAFTYLIFSAPIHAQIVPAPKADIAISIVSTPKMLPANHMGSISTVVEIDVKGPIDSRNIALDLVLSKDNKFPYPPPYAVYSETFREDALLKGGRTFIELKPGKQKIKLSGVMPASTTPGNYFLIAIADAGNRMPESVESNNIAAAPITIYDPDELQTWAGQSTTSMIEVLRELNEKPGLEAMSFSMHAVDKEPFFNLILLRNHSENGIEGHWNSKIFETPDEVVRFINADKVGDQYISEFDISAGLFQNKNIYWVLYRLSDKITDNHIGWKLATDVHDLIAYAGGYSPITTTLTVCGLPHIPSRKVRHSYCSTKGHLMTFVVHFGFWNILPTRKNSIPG
ncbi:MAG: hypothetical protein IPL65_22505 [Lewinellaceae bacterium]|nr:hypothetical protein [Lewinellaceae bacterium]